MGKPTLFSNGKAILALMLTGVIAIIGISTSSSLVERVDAGEIVVLQDPIDGELHVFSEPGLYNQGFGTITRYEKSEQVWFTLPSEDHPSDNSALTQFNDGGKAWVSGSVRYDLPSDPQAMIALHTKYRSSAAVHDALVVPTIEKMIYMSGPLMSSTESYAARRSELLEYIQDQTDNGVYKTQVHEETRKDPLSGEETVVKITQVVYDDNGLARRNEMSPFQEFGLRTRNLVISDIRYDKDVQAQIDRQREMTMAIQTAKAESLQAEQDAITAEERGKARAAEAKWAQEVEKATQVTVAERQKAVAELKASEKLEVQRLATQTAAEYKKEQQLRGEGDAAYKRAVMQADGALKQKLETYERVQANWAEAFAKTRVVPEVVVGGSGNQTSASNFMDFMMIQAARDLQVNPRPQQ